MSSGTLILAATPIGDVRDASPRLRELLATCDVVAAEDTRRLRRLAAALDVDVGGTVIAYHEHSEGVRTARLVDRLLAGDDVLLVTDAGMPSVSDPGYRLVAAAVAAGVAVTAAPGPSALLVALALSGLPSDRFTFEGFLPRKGGQRRTRLSGLAQEERTMVFFEAPHRIDDVLTDMRDIFGAERPAAVCRELTKTYEEVVRGPLDELAHWAEGDIKGEITLVVGGRAHPAVELSDAELREQVDELVAGGQRRSEAIDVVAGIHGLSKRRVYSAAHGPAEQAP
jgi:16S rRNA (cytidine1402-2'-O)-methyltransferase